MEPAIYELDDEAVHLSRVTTGKRGVWTASNQLQIKDAETVNLRGMLVDRQVDKRFCWRVRSRRKSLDQRLISLRS